METVEIKKENEFIYEICISCNNLKIDTLQTTIYKHPVYKITEACVITNWGQRFKKNRLGIDLFYDRQEAINALEKFKLPYKIAEY